MAPTPFAPLDLALEAADAYRGATSPNPPVGAVGLDREGRVLAVSAHQRAGAPHAEIGVIEACRTQGTLGQLHTLVVTLEPCNHTGRTGPCTDAILATPVREVVFGCADPNPRVAGGGATRLQASGLRVKNLEDPRARSLIAPWAKHTRTGLPWVTVKVALNSQGSMIPEPGSRTFTSPDSLRLAHQLRKRADAILTGSGTVLADRPALTVRHVADPRPFPRWLALVDRRGRIPREWLQEAEGRGFRVLTGLELGPTLKRLGELGVQEVLVEAGPVLTEALRTEGLWDEEVRIEVQGPGLPDRVSYTLRS